MTYKGQRLYIEDDAFTKIGLEPGKRYLADIVKEKHLITLMPSEYKGNKISSKSKRGKVVGVVDKEGKEIREVLSECTNIKITFYKDEEIGGRVVIQGTKSTAKAIETEGIKEEKRQLTSITFCAGSGISASCNTKAGFKEVAFCEWDPKSGKEDKYANIFAANHPESVMFNVPLQQLSSADLPYSDLWVFTLDCTDYSLLASTKSEDQFKTIHLFMHLMRLFWEKPKLERPKAILVENVPGFEKVAGRSLELALKEEGFYVEKAKMNSLDYMSRTKRERYFLVATIYDGYKMPQPIGRMETAVIDDGVITLDSLEWQTPETSATLKYFIDREGNISHNHKIIDYDITKDSYIGTITKSHYKLVPENLIRHPNKSNTYAFIKSVDHLKYLHSIDKDYYLGDSNSTAIQCIGQGVDCNTFYAIVKKLHDFLCKKIFSNKEEKATKYNLFYKGDQLCFEF